MARSMKGPGEEEENVNYGKKKISFTLFLFSVKKAENIAIHVSYLYLVFVNSETVFRDMLIN